MAYGDLTDRQAKTGYGWQFWMEHLTGSAVSAATAAAAKYVKIEGMRSGALPSPDRPEIDCTTTIDKVKAFLPGIGSMTDISLDFNFYPENAVHQHLVQEVLYSNKPRWWQLSYVTGMKFAFSGYLKSANSAFGVDQVLSMPLVLKVTSKPEITFTTSAQMPEAGDVDPADGGVALFGLDNMGKRADSRDGVRVS